MTRMACFAAAEGCRWVCVGRLLIQYFLAGLHRML